MKSRLPWQIYILMGAAILLGVLLWQVNRQAPQVDVALEGAAIIAGIPSIPNLSGWPKELLSELKRVHTAFNDPETRIEALSSLGELYFANGFYGEAMQCFSALVTVVPEEARWPYFLGIASRDYQDKTDAIYAFERALMLDGSYTNVRYELGMALAESGHIMDSVVHFEALLKIRGWEAWARYGLARSLFLEERYMDADQQLQRAIDLDPEVRKFYELREEIGLYAGDYEKAKQAGRKRDEIPFEKKPYDPWVQQLWESCFDVFRLVRLAESEALEGNAEASLNMLAKAKSLSGSLGYSGEDIEAVEKLIQSRR